MLSLPVMITVSPLAIISSDAACHVVPLNSTFPFSCGEMAVSAKAVFPRNSSSSNSERCFLCSKIFDNDFRSSKTLIIELAVNIISCSLIERSIKRQRMAVTQAPTAKKKRINPGKTNSNTNKTNPIIVQMTAAVSTVSIIIPKRSFKYR